MVFYNCEKCNKEFSQKSNYLSHINRKKSCIIDDDDDNTNVIIYKCNKCNKEFNQKCNYLSHINRKKSCISNDNTNNIILYYIFYIYNIPFSIIYINNLIFKLFEN
jgi:uncharacterized C2H2 Zn-finger protein